MLLDTVSLQPWPVLCPPRAQRAPAARLLLPLAGLDLPVLGKWLDMINLMT